MRLREITSGVVVHVDDARGAAMVGAKWEVADKPPAPAKKTEAAGKKPAPRRRTKKAE